MRRTAAVVAIAAVVGLTGCGGDDGPTQEDRDRAGAFCVEKMKIDRFDNGYADCVDDVAKVVDCLGPSSRSIEPWIPTSCEWNGYQ